MNYRHIYHAGNPADIFKHVLFAWVLDYMNKKPAPYRVIDTHAGLGRYHLQSDLALKTGEWQQGYGLLEKHKASPALLKFIAPFLAAQKALNSEGRVNLYAGSPEIAARLVRPTDKVIVNELQLQDYEICKKNYIWAQNVKVMNRDGYEMLSGSLPPPEKRGVILIDPPFEEKDEETRLLEALLLIKQKFPTGVALLWYPIKEAVRLNFLIKNAKSFGIDKCVNITHMFRPLDDVGFTGNGVLMLNPPFGLEQALKAAEKEFLAMLNMKNGWLNWEWV